jgi:hypothetical protein
MKFLIYDPTTGEIKGQVMCSSEQAKHYKVPYIREFLRVGEVPARLDRYRVDLNTKTLEVLSEEEIGQIEDTVPGFPIQAIEEP